jgi:anti-sigma factor RsiW
MRLKLLCVVVAVALAACGSSGQKLEEACQPGITFLFRAVAGALPTGGTRALNVCFDGTCLPVTVSRSDASRRQFLSFAAVGVAGPHTVTVAATDSSAIKGSFTGEIPVYVQKTSVNSCALATFDVGETGTLTVGVPQVTATTKP